MNKRISVIQIGQCPSDKSKSRDWADPSQYSTPERPQFLVDFEYSQGHLSWENTDDPLKAMDLNTCRGADAAITHFISGFSKDDKPELQGKIRTFIIKAEEVPPDIILIRCPICFSHFSVEERMRGNYGVCTGYKCQQAARAAQVAQQAAKQQGIPGPVFHDEPGFDGKLDVTK